MRRSRIDVKRYHVSGDAWPIILAFLNGKPVYRKGIVPKKPVPEKSA
jgi:hypothetical protein